MCARLVMVSKGVGMAVLFLDIVPVKLGDLKEMCELKNIKMEHPKGRSEFNIFM